MTSNTVGLRPGCVDGGFVLLLLFCISWCTSVGNDVGARVVLEIFHGSS